MDPSSTSTNNNNTNNKNDSSITTGRKKVVSIVAALVLIGLTVAFAVCSIDSSATGNENSFVAKFQVTGQLSDTVKRLETQVAALTAGLNAIKARFGSNGRSEVRIAAVPGPKTPVRNQVYGHVNFEGRKRYSLVFEIKSRGPNAAWTNIFHVGNDNNIRSPVIFQFPRRRDLHFQQQMIGPNNMRYNWVCDPTEAQTPPFNHWYRVSLTFEPNRAITVRYNNAIRCRTEHRDMNVPSGDQKVYLSDPWYVAAPVEIKNLVFKIY